MKEGIRVLVAAPILIGSIAGILSKPLFSFEHGMLRAIILFVCALGLWVLFMFVPYWKRAHARES